MRELSIEVTPETFEALEVERSLIGFKSRSAYLRWIIDNRAGIDQGSQPDWLVDAYQQRVESLEGRGEATPSEGDGDRPTADGTESAPAPNRPATDADGRVADRNRPEVSGGRQETGQERSATVSATTQSHLDDLDGSFGGESNTVETNAAGANTVETNTAESGGRVESGPDPSQPANGETETGGVTTVGQGEREAAGDSTDDERTTVRTSDGLELRGTVGTTTVERGPRATRGDDCTRNGDGARDDDGDRRSTDRVRARTHRVSGSVDDDAVGIDSVHLTPERIERIREDAIARDAGLLGSVQVERVDELSRRAVAKTRQQLNRDVETGLEYVSSTTLADETIRPGEDVVDLDALSIPGRSDEVVEKRREVVGRAVAFLRDDGSARKADFVDALYEEFPAGYDTADSWWRCVKSGLKQVDVVDGGEGTRVWRYDG